jgi:hypothetical protein
MTGLEEKKKESKGSLPLPPKQTNERANGTIKEV